MLAQEYPSSDTPHWYVLRDLKRSNAKFPAYKMLPELGFETFTPMHWVLTDSRTGGKTRRYLPIISGLIFAKSVKADLDRVIDKTLTLQYRFVKGAPQNTPMIVPADDMERFRRAVGASQSCDYYSPDEITPDMIGRKVRIVGGLLDGTTGHLLKKKGSKKKRLILELKNALVAAIEVEPEFIQLV